MVRFNDIDYTYDPRTDNGTGSNTRGNYAPFYGTAFVKDNGYKKKWTMSTNIKTDTVTDKMPVNMYNFMEKGVITGAMQNDSLSYCTLDELVDFFPVAPNHTFCLDALTDGYCILDIEPKCPDNVKAELIKMDFDYAESSMSGKGIHLIFPLPACIKKYPIAQKKTAMKGENGWYEILLQHQVTFTRNTLDIPRGTEPFAPFFEKLCAAQVDTSLVGGEVTADRPEIPFYDAILQFMNIRGYKKTLEDHNNDMSSYEFGIAYHLYTQMDKMLHTGSIMIKRHEYTPNERAWILYGGLVKCLPHRDKHDEIKCGVPHLLYTAQRMVSSRLAKEAEREIEKAKKKAEKEAAGKDINAPDEQS